jgi:hypothetical protein
MPIINKGVFNINSAYLREVGNDWPTAQVISTADVVEVSSNLYFTSSRVVTAVTPLLTTANVIETSANLYFTNARVLSALTGNVTIGNLLTTGQIVATAPGSAETGAGQLYLNGATNNRIDWAAVGTGSPTFTTRSDGTKVVLYPSLGGGTVDYAMGIDSATMWSSVPEYGDSFKFKWFGATTEIASLTGTGTFTVKTIQANVWNGLYTSNVIELTNLYFTNARVMANLEQMSVNVFTDVDLTGIQVSSTLIWNGTKFVPGSPDVAASNFANTAGFANVSLLSDVANTVLSLSNFTTANLAEGTNLYFTNSRVRTAFSPGKGIAITSDGIIKNTGSQPQYNLDINGTAGGNVLSTMSSVLTFPTIPTTDRYLLRSLHVVNTSGATALISGNVVYATGNTASLANQIPVAQGGVLEFIKTYQLFQPGDTINLQGFNTAGTPTANLMTAMLTYETFSSDQSFIGIGQTIANVDTNTQIYDSSQSYSIFESIKFINLQSDVVPIRCYWGDANGVPKAYLAYGLQLPPNTSVELLQSAKRINQNDKLYASYSGAPNAAVSVFVSARLGATYSIGPYVAAAPTGNAISVAFSTTDAEGALLYYTIE